MTKINPTRTIKFCNTLSSILLGNLGRQHTSMLGTKPFLHNHFSRNGVGYFKTQMTDMEISTFLHKNKISQDKYFVLDSSLSPYSIYIGKFDYVSIEFLKNNC
jgi:hypothetical protein